MKQKKIIISLGLVLISLLSLAQNTNWCGFSANQLQMKEYANRVSRIVDSRAMQLRPDCLNKTFSIHLHLIGENSNSDYANIDTITASIDSLNLAFEPICVSFEVCRVDYHLNSVYFDELIDTNYSRLFTLYADSGVINIFFIESFDDGDVQGLASLPPGDFFALATENHKVLIHEMGHYLGLIHTHDNEYGAELVDRSNCSTTGDLLCDTEADPNLYDLVNNDCSYSYSTTDSNGDFYTPPLFNHMSYSNSNCRKEFTPLQFLIMIDVLINVRTNLH